MIGVGLGEDAGAAGGADDLLTRTEASAFLSQLGIQLKPASLARLWSTGSNGPPCRHIRSKPFYPRGLLRDWACSQITDVRTGAPTAARGGVVARADVTAAQILADPAASFALKAVLRAWRQRDPIDAANDARLLRDLLEDEADQRLAGICDDRG